MASHFVHAYFLLNNHKKNPHCYYCGRLTIHDRERNRFYNKLQRSLPEDTATVEHLYPKDDLRRLLLDHKEHRVIACIKCNLERNKQTYVVEKVKEHVNIISILLTGTVITCLRT